MSDKKENLAMQTKPENSAPQPVDKKVARMGSASIPKLLTEFAIPAIAGMIVNAAYTLIDSIFLGQAVGSIGLSAITVATPMVTLLMAFAMLLGSGGNALAALKLGEGQRAEAQKVLGNTLSLCAIVSVLVAAFVLFPPAIEWLLVVSSATPEVAPHAESFIRIVGLGFIFQCVGMGINNFIRTAGAPVRALITMVIGAVSCTIFNAIFVLGLGMGVEGSALATVLGQAVSAVSVLWFFIGKKDASLHLRRKFLKICAKTSKSIIVLGLPSFAMSVGMTVVMFLINFLLVKYGTTSDIGAVGAMASIGVVQRIAMFVVMPIIGVGIAAQPLLGFNYGAKNIDRVKKTVMYAAAMGTSIAIFMWLLTRIFPDQIISAFGITDVALSDFTEFAMMVQLAMVPLIGVQIVFSGYFQATGQAMKSIFLSTTRQIIFLVPLMIILPEVMPDVIAGTSSLDALYYAAPISDCLSIITSVTFMSLEWRRLGKLQNRQEIKEEI